MCSVSNAARCGASQRPARLVVDAVSLRDGVDPVPIADERACGKRPYRMRGGQNAPHPESTVSEFMVGPRVKASDRGNTGRPRRSVADC